MKPEPPSNKYNFMKAPKRFLAPILALMLAFSLSVIAQAAGPALPNSKYKVKIHADREGARYTIGEKVVFNIDCNLEGKPASDISLNYSLRVNDFKEVARGAIKITNGSGAVDYTWGAPGCLLLVLEIPEQKEPELGGAVCKPEEIGLSMPKPGDFDTFWTEMKTKVDAIPPEPSLVPVAKFTDDKVETYALVMQNINGAKVRCFFAKPKGAGPFPAYMEVHGAGYYPITPDLVANYAHRGVMAIDMYAHDLELNNPKSYYEEMSQTTLKQYWWIGRDSRESSYFLPMFCGNYRTAKYVTNRPEWDQKHFVVHGFSQGGAQAFATAYLYPKVTALAANEAALCDHTGPQVGRVAGWPGWIAYKDSKPDPKQFAAARYFDSTNFAQTVSARALISLGFIDRTCPPSSVYATYNVFKGPKQLLEMPLIRHDFPAVWRVASKKFIDEELGGIHD